VGVGIALLGVRLVFHLLTLPVELDASFRRALPILETGRFLDAGDMPAPAPCCAPQPFTYVASSLVSLVNIARFRRLLPF
jgi:Zn-dependent membrane protease YugP